MFPILSLSGEGDDMSPGQAYGGGLGLQLGPTTALRATVNISKSNHRSETVNLSNPTFTQSYFGIDLMFGAPSDAGLAPYIFFGSGRLTVDPAQASLKTFTKLAGRLGTGVNYVPDNSFIVLFVEAYGWIYEFELLGFKEFQLNSAILVGMAFAVPF
jgi:hypothetical protein